jgi:hypothetical protein
LNASQLTKIYYIKISQVTSFIRALHYTGGSVIVPAINKGFMNFKELNVTNIME